jgi:hypothetical protein
MHIEMPSDKSIGEGREVPCAICDGMYRLGSMIGIDSPRNPGNQTKLVCSINCLIQEIYNISAKSKPAYH